MATDTVPAALALYAIIGSGIDIRRVRVATAATANEAQTKARELLGFFEDAHDIVIEREASHG